jgi:hypothetical protein
MAWIRPSATLCEAFIALTLTAGFAPAHAQAHEKRVGAYVLRSSTVASQNIDAATARAHGVNPEPTLGVINVMVSHVSDPAGQNVPADVSVSATSLTGRRRHIDMRQVVDNGMISYLGTYHFEPREVLDFAVTARPDHVKKGITLVYRDRMWVPRR